MRMALRTRPAWPGLAWGAMARAKACCRMHAVLAFVALCTVHGGLAKLLLPAEVHGCGMCMPCVCVAAPGHHPPAGWMKLCTCT